VGTLPLALNADLVQPSSEKQRRRKKDPQSLRALPHVGLQHLRIPVRRWMRHGSGGLAPLRLIDCLNKTSSSLLLFHPPETSADLNTSLAFDEICSCLATETNSIPSLICFSLPWIRWTLNLSLRPRPDAAISFVCPSNFACKSTNTYSRLRHWSFSLLTASRARASAPRSRHSMTLARIDSGSTLG